MIDTSESSISVVEKNLQYFAAKKELKKLHNKYRRAVLRLPDRNMRVLKCPEFLANDAPLPYQLSFSFDPYI
jgi:hypothetical protein